MHGNELSYKSSLYSYVALELEHAHKILYQSITKESNSYTDHEVAINAVLLHILHYNTDTYTHSYISYALHVYRLASYLLFPFKPCCRELPASLDNNTCRWKKLYKELPISIAILTFLFKLKECHDPLPFPSHIAIYTAHWVIIHIFKAAHASCILGFLCRVRLQQSGYMIYTYRHELAFSYIEVLYNIMKLLSSAWLMMYKVTTTCRSLLQRFV